MSSSLPVAEVDAPPGEVSTHSPNMTPTYRTPGTESAADEPNAHVLPYSESTGSSARGQEESGEHLPFFGPRTVSIRIAGLDRGIGGCLRHGWGPDGCRSRPGFRRARHPRKAHTTDHTADDHTTAHSDLGRRSGGLEPGRYPATRRSRSPWRREGMEDRGCRRAVRGRRLERCALLSRVHVLG